MRRCASYLPEFPDWTGERALIVGGGPSIAEMPWAEIRHFDGRVIALNEAGLTVVPEADAFYWADPRWGKWNVDRYHLNKSPWKYTSTDGNIDDWPGTQYVQTENTVPFHTIPQKIMGTDSGSRAINLAYHMRLRAVVLIGFDMHDYPKAEWRKGNFHNMHKDDVHPNCRRDVFMPSHKTISENLPEGFEVLNATPGSALTCYPTVNWETIQ